MITSLFVKEARQHWAAFLFLLLLDALGLGLLVLLALVLRKDMGSGLQGLRYLLMSLIPLNAIILCNRLVVAEYQGKTQLFLAALPMPRGAMILVKYLVGLLFLIGFYAVSLVVEGGIWRASEALTAGFLVIVAAKGMLFIWCVYGFFFMMGFLGRYRFIMYVALALSVTLAVKLCGFDLSRLCLLSLVDERFAFERTVPPVGDLAWPAVLACGFLVTACVLGLVREGSGASMLGERMSHREKVFASIFVIGLLFSIVTFYDKTKEKKPFDLAGAAAVSRGGVTVRVACNAPGGDEMVVAERIASQLAAVKEYLGLERTPPVFITRRLDLDADLYERGDLKDAEGVLVRINPSGEGWDERAFAAWLIKEFLVEQSHKRVLIEERRWILDGFPLYWLGLEGAERLPGEEEAQALRALYGARQPLTTEDLQSWLLFRERVGDPIASAVACSGLRALAKRKGAGACAAFLRASLGMNPPPDARAFLRELGCSVGGALRSAAGMSLDDFLTAWNEELAQARSRYGSRLERLPTLSAEVTFERLSPLSSKVFYRLKVTPRQERDLCYFFEHMRLPAFDTEVDRRDLKRERHSFPATTGGALTETLSRGDRFYSGFTMRIPELGCEVTSGWTRRDVGQSAVVRP